MLRSVIKSDFIIGTFSGIKSSVIERFNRTVNERLEIHFEINDNFKWTKILPVILEDYNNHSIHRTIGTVPARVTKSNENEIYERVYPLKKFKLKRPVFKLGDRVRISWGKELFGNKYSRHWSTEIFRVDNIHYTEPITYSLRALDGEEILGKFYTRELQKTKF